MLKRLTSNSVKKGEYPLVLHFVSQFRHVLIGKIYWRLAQSETMPFNLSWLCFLIDPIELDDKMLNLTEVPNRDTDQVQESTSTPTCKCLQRCDLKVVLFLCDASKVLILKREFIEI